MATTPISKSRADRAGARYRRWMDLEIDLDRDEALAVFEDMDAWRATHAYPLSLVTSGVRNWVSQETESEIVVGQRLKRFDRIVSKLDRFPSMRLSQMEDIAGCRAVLLDPEEVEAVARRIRRKWDVRAESDYRDAGKPDTGYRGLHIIVLRRDRLVEIQLRTGGQHYWAEIAERTSSRTGYNLKDGEGPEDLIDYFRVASDLTWQRENMQELDAGLLAELEKLRPIVRPYFASPPRRRPRRR